MDMVWETPFLVGNKCQYSTVLAQKSLADNRKIQGKEMDKLFAPGRSNPEGILFDSMILARNKIRRCTS